ncbi:hypothetical protein BLNAU_20558 [Blattamonas nauphoetae]|uniref:Uncharacterized protein n=1 Tax=Blattamonas nauphoetae TaxID=2049346 RepID=A0ABQ9WYC0_9EUKA|nr:hypothetical protein BLNAU_20558 [Blattamonas nauphoetae]
MPPSRIEDSLPSEASESSGSIYSSHRIPKTLPHSPPVCEGIERRTLTKTPASFPPITPCSYIARPSLCTTPAHIPTAQPPTGECSRAAARFPSEA